MLHLIKSKINCQLLLLLLLDGFHSLCAMSNQYEWLALLLQSNELCTIYCFVGCFFSVYLVCMRFSLSHFPSLFVFGFFLPSYRIFCLLCLVLFENSERSSINDRMKYASESLLSIDTFIAITLHYLVSVRVKLLPQTSNRPVQHFVKISKHVTCFAFIYHFIHTAYHRPVKTLLKTMIL